MDDIDALRKRIKDLEKEISELRQRNQELVRLKNNGASDDFAAPISEFEGTLRRVVQQTAMIVQAEKCVIMVRDRESGELVAKAPAFGITEDEVRTFRVSGDTGFSGGVYLNGEPAILTSPENEPEEMRRQFKRLRIRNGVSVPLMIEKRDDHNHIAERYILGVLHCFNKRYGGEFIEEDVRLLERLSRNAAAIIANAQMFQEVVEERQKLVHTLESLTAGLILINAHGRIGQMNAQARAMFGIAEGENPVGKPYQEVIRHEQSQAILQKKLTAPETIADADGDLSDAEIAPDEISIKDEQDEEYIYQVHSAGVHDDNNAPIGTVFIFNDITDIRNVERMKTEFVSIVSHELRTPLTPMKGFVRTLLDDENEEWYTAEDRREFYGIIEQNVDRLKRLIDDLLNVSRIERMGSEGIEMNWEDVDIRDAAEQTVGTQSGQTSKHTLVIDFEPERFTAETDADKILNILNNLLSNAIKYSPDGGEIRVIGRLEPPTETFPEGAVLIGVKDHGLGMTENMKKKIGQKFIRDLENKKIQKVGGTGIGLFYVKNLIERHHGTMWADSELGKGSTFWFRFPRVQPKPEGETPDASESASP